MRPLKPLPSPSERRPGAVLLVVITLMALFTAVGLSFVYYAEAEATASKLFRESAHLGRPDVEPELALSYFLSKFIYPERDDDQSGIYNAGRGHELARGIYGNNYNIVSINGTPTIVMQSPQKPYTGTGPLHYPYPPVKTGGNPILAGQDNYGLPNYQFRPLDGFLRDPERFYLDPLGQPTTRTDPSQSPIPRPKIEPFTGGFAGGFNAPYTYPDLANFFLAAVRADGTVLTPSYHREYLFGRLDDATNPNWYNSIGKYLTLRPRPIDQVTPALAALYNSNVPAAQQALLPPYTDFIPKQKSWEKMTLGEQQNVMAMIIWLQGQNRLLPYPEDRGGDVRNLPQGLGFMGQGYNDSIWTDFGAPVMIAEDGRKYKMMFSVLVKDLDGLVNLNVHGNIKNNGTSYAGNQGFGRWEVDLSQVLNAADVVQLFRGRTNPAISGRYGTAKGPHLAQANAAGVRALWSPYAPPAGLWYSVTDFDGIHPAGQMYLPKIMNAGSAVTSFPTYPGTGYGNVSNAELVGPIHPAAFNYYSPFGVDRTFPISDMEALLRYADKGSPALDSELFRLLPNSLSNARVRNMVTTYSHALNRPTLTGWLWDPANHPYRLTAARLKTITPFPIGPAMPFPQYGATVPAGSEFNANLTAIPTLINRLDLNRPLTAYPAQDSALTMVKGAIVPSKGTGLIPAAQFAQFQQAQLDRQNFARDIYNLLLQVTGGRDPNTVVPKGGVPVKPGEVNAARWLAQLAVNIVDYIDNDDYMTPFDWLNNQSEILWGTELPRLVLNEAYVGVDGVVDPKVNSQMSIWLELLDTFRQTGGTDATAWPRDFGAAVLQSLKNTPYRIDVCNAAGLQQLSDPLNFTGDPGAGNIQGSVTIWGALPGMPQAVLPNNDVYADSTNTNVGFYVVGPPPGTGPALPTTPGATAPGLSFQINVDPTQPNSFPTILLRRLACPHLPPDPSPTTKDKNGKIILNPMYNPYITVDAMTQVPINDARINPNGKVPPSYSQFASWGRRQPYAAFFNPAFMGDPKNQLVAQSPLPPLPAKLNLPQNTFFRHNGQENPPAKAPTQTPTLNRTITQTLGEYRAPAGKNPAGINPRFDWLVHLDRAPISPLELLHVSSYPPHKLTQKFITMTAATTGKVTTTTLHKFQHYARWFENNTRLARFFEYIATHDFAAGMAYPTRVPGKVNINTVWDLEVFLALCGPDPTTNSATPTDVARATAIYNSLIGQRSPNAASNQIGPSDLHTTLLPPGYQLDRPFRSLATGFTQANLQFPNGTGVQNTILGALGAGSTSATGTRLLDESLAITPNHPYLKHRFLTKLFNNLTTHSNTFAVWVTVGFFEVVDDTARPVKLGAEIGRAENRHVRHRFFAIVDRSDLRRLTIPISPTGGQLTAGQVATMTLASPTVVPDSAQPAPNQPPAQMLLWSSAGTAFAVNPGDEVVLDPNTPNEETVVISSVVHDLKNADTWQFTFTPTRTHMQANNTTPIPAAFRGNPGPWANYNPRLDPLVVRYFSVID